MRRSSTVGLRLAGLSTPAAMHWVLVEMPWARRSPTDGSSMSTPAQETTPQRMSSIGAVTSTMSLCRLEPRDQIC